MELSRENIVHFLHLEDSSTDAELAEGVIRAEWPQCQFTRVQGRTDFEKALDGGRFNLILSDYTMPGFDGLTALELARNQRPDTPFVFLSGTIGEERAIDALKLGASDYVLKDHPHRLVPAMRQALSREVEAGKLRKANQRVHEQAEWLDKAGDAICALDSAHRVTFWNASAERIFGWNADDALGNNFESLLFPIDPSPCRAAMRSVAAKGEWTGELRPTSKSAAIVTVDCRGTLISRPDGGAQHMLVIATDVTERKKLEAQLLGARRLESIATLAGGIAHEINNVLNPIVGAAGLLRPRLNDASDIELLGLVEAGADHATALVRQLLAFARGAESAHAEVRLRHMIADLGGMFRAILPANIKFATASDDNLWSVQGDSIQLDEVLMNLCVNARDAMPNGGRLEVRAENVELDDSVAHALGLARPGRHVKVTVTDTGCGISQDNIGRIFEPFFTTKPFGKGTGLGLSAVRGIVRGHGGAIRVDSELGQGTKFQIHLPASNGSPGAVIAPVEKRREGGTALVVDDNDGVRTVLELLLAGAGYRVISASDGMEGLAAHHRESGAIDVVVTDIMMPGLNGIEVIRALRASDPAIGVVAVSGMMDVSRSEIERMPGPPIVCLEKPVNRAKLLSAVELVARKSR